MRNKMILIPATDLIDGQCVRLVQGDYARQTVYSKDPLVTAQSFQSAGFTHLHMVDLDGARKKSPVHFPVLKKVSRSTSLFIDYSGGIRNLPQAEQAFENGASAITVGSLAVKDPELTLTFLEHFGDEKVILGADVKNNRIATAGWMEESDLDLFTFLEGYLGKGFRKVMITDVSKDGMMEGPAVTLYQKVLEKFPEIKLIASGGIAHMQDIYDLDAMGCFAAIAGKALYEKNLDVDELQKYLQT